MIDDEISVSGPNPWGNDSIELYFENNGPYSELIEYAEYPGFRWVWGSPSSDYHDEQYAWGELEGLNGYTFELRMPLIEINSEAYCDYELGFDIEVNDRDNEYRENKIRWWSSDNAIWHEHWRMGKVSFMNCPDIWPPYISLVYPRGSEIFTADEGIIISWNSPGIKQLVDIYISFNNGVDWEVVATSIPSSDSYTYIIPDQPTEEGFIKVQSSDGHYSSINNWPFTIDGTSNMQSELNSTLPNEFQLYQNYPNPFNPNTTIRYELPEMSEVQIIVFDMLGNEVAVLEESVKLAGSHHVHFDASDLSSGVYFYTLETESQIFTRKMLLMK
ncbi:T9SS type A sorting domain-containing protein [bacterium]